MSPLALFVSFYVATLLGLVWIPIQTGAWGSLLAAVLASAGAIVLWEGGEWNLGIAVAPRVAAADTIFGLASGAILVGACAAAVVATTDLDHAPGNGFPWREILAVYVPAAIHEELLFRGYPLQKIMQRSPGAAVVVTSLVFALLHIRNEAVTALAIGNVFLGGIVLGLAYLRRRNLWFPIALHLAWNVMAGPVLGHEVSGFPPEASLLREAGAGPDWLTGGRFGIEGSAWMTVAECSAIIVLVFWRSRPGMRPVE